MASTASRTATDEATHADGATPNADRPLGVSEAGLARLRARLAGANRDNPDFEAQFARLMAVVSHAVNLLRTHELAPSIELVLAAGAWAHGGIDLRTLPLSEEVYLDLVVRLPTRDYGFEKRLAGDVFAVVDDGSVFLHFTVITLSQWKHALEHLRSTDRDPDLLGIPLLVRT